MATEPQTDTGGMREGYNHLERAYMQEYLRGHGFSLETLRDLPAERAKALLRDASIYASMKLSEVEARAHLVEELHGGTRSI
ncbi:MAG: hypothetical protein HC822_10980 [Oscillochloris sp.]|nr:hypothetical protein [Oscillochloris sp.]